MRVIELLYMLFSIFSMLKFGINICNMWTPSHVFIQVDVRVSYITKIWKCNIADGEKEGGLYYG